MQDSTVANACYPGFGGGWFIIFIVILLIVLLPGVWFGFRPGIG